MKHYSKKLWLKVLGLNSVTLMLGSLALSDHRMFTDLPLLSQIQVISSAIGIGLLMVFTLLVDVGFVSGMMEGETT